MKYKYEVGSLVKLSPLGIVLLPVYHDDMGIILRNQKQSELYLCYPKVCLVHWFKSKRQAWCAEKEMEKIS
ncbi:MAG: hypothetical protein Q8P81_03580 [Nanoarchaeota archaeon]|nr:hypothetical protein [Nanoarchaeota archaeon]